MRDLMRGDLSIEELIYEGPRGVGIIPQSSTIAAYQQLTTRQKQNLLLAMTQLQHDYDYVMIDTAAGIDHSTISFLLGAGSIVITITPDPNSLNDAFGLLKGIKQRVFQEPVRVIVNLVAGEMEAKLIIARLSITIRQVLGSQCGNLSFFILNDHILEVITRTSLVTLQHPDSVPSQCLADIAMRLTDIGEVNAASESAMDDSAAFIQQPGDIGAERTPQWFAEAIFSVQNDSMDLVQQLMLKLNAAWDQRRTLQLQHDTALELVELELLRLKTAIHFARKVGQPPKILPKS